MDIIIYFKHEIIFDIIVCYFSCDVLHERSAFVQDFLEPLDLRDFLEIPDRRDSLDLKELLVSWERLVTPAQLGVRAPLEPRVQRSLAFLFISVKLYVLCAAAFGTEMFIV